MKNTVIFDLDGLLIDSEIISFRLYEELTGKYGRSMTLEEYATDYSGKTGITNMKLLLEKYQLPITFDAGTAGVFKGKSLQNIAGNVEYRRPRRGNSAAEWDP